MEKTIRFQQQLEPVDRRLVHKSRIENVFISNLNQPEPGVDRFLASLIVDTNHRFFFEHRIEHIPGMLLVEGARQMLEACSHKYGGVPFNGFQFIVTEIRIEFVRFTELHLPLILEAIVEDKLDYESGIWADLGATVHAYQSDENAASLHFKWNVVSRRVFDRMRSTKKPVDHHPWFFLKSEVEYHIMLRGIGTEKIQGELEYFNTEELLIKVSSRFKETIHTGGNLELFLYFSGIGFVHGEVRADPVQEFDDFVLVRASFVSIDGVDKKNLHEAIKQYGYLVENWSL